MGDYDMPLPETSTLDWIFNNRYTLLSLALGLIVVFTRLISTLNSSSKTTEYGAKTPPAVPYYIPLLGHIPNMAISPDNFLKSLRNLYKGGIFSLNFGGSRHNVLYTPGLATALLNAKSTNVDNEAVGKRFMQLIFGLPTAEYSKYEESFEELMACYKHLMNEPGLSQITDVTTRRTMENVLNLVTGMESPVDQMPWEKASNVQVIERANGEQVVEASLFSLIRDFCAYAVIPTFMGPDFLGNFPEFVDDLWILDQGFMLLGTGLPRWAPIPSLTRAHIARKKNLERLDTFHEKLEQHWNGEDPGPKWSSLDQIGMLVKAREEMYRKFKLSIRARASIEHSLMWASNANSNPLVFWMINRIYYDRALLAMVREEMAPYVVVEQPKTGLPIAEPARITKLDVDGLCNNCPLLKSCYIECLRLDAGTWSLKIVKSDFVIQSREKDAQSWLLRKGDWAHAAHDLHNSDPDYFENPNVWKADRHIKYDEKKEGVADMGSIRPYGGGVSMCKGRAFALRETMMFAAALISMWDLEPADGGEWKIPRHRRATGVFGTGDDTRVLLKRRKFS